MTVLRHSSSGHHHALRKWKRRATCVEMRLLVAHYPTFDADRQRRDLGGYLDEETTTQQCGRVELPPMGPLFCLRRGPPETGPWDTLILAQLIGRGYLPSVEQLRRVWLHCGDFDEDYMSLDLKLFTHKLSCFPTTVTKSTCDQTPTKGFLSVYSLDVAVVICFYSKNNVVPLMHSSFVLEL